MAIHLYCINFACQNQNFIKPKLVTPKLRPFEFDAASARATVRCRKDILKRNIILKDAISLSQKFLNLGRLNS